ncbi:hypothetical protein [Acuticoccus yangtzensis]|uniref:hypothetical protein n=1 Tax=Acuticoccus yangtzensis TaxID=1443441 RepID=UPI001FE8C561|nr:hypothetical protein [Acuticoccus yangtzensis]
MLHGRHVALGRGIEDVAHEEIALAGPVRQQRRAIEIRDFTHHDSTIVISPTGSTRFVISPTLISGRTFVISPTKIRDFTHLLS